MLRCVRLAQTGVLAGLIILFVGCAQWIRGAEFHGQAAAFTQATNLSQLLDLGDKVDGTLLPVRLEGTVCWIDPSHTLVALQANSRLAFFEIDLKGRSVGAGDLLEIEGNCLIQSTRYNLRRAPVVDNDGVHAMIEKTGTVFLRAGKHALEVRWFDKGGACGLQVGYEGPGLSRQLIPGTALFGAELDPVRGITNYVQGLEYRAYEGDWDRLPDFEQLKPVRHGRAAGFDLKVRTRTNNVGLVFTGFLEVPRDGLYTFYTESDDGSRLSVDEHAPQIAVRPNHGLPTPRRVVPGQPFLRQEHQWSEVEGEVTFITGRAYGFDLELSSVQGRLTAILPDSPRLSPSFLSNARLRLRGICQGIYSTAGQQVAARLLVPNPETVEVLSVAPAVWGAYPVSSISPKLGSPMDEPTNAVVHVQGKVRGITTARHFTLEDATGSVAVETLQPLTVGAGTAVEVLGRRSQTATNAALAGAVWRETANVAGRTSGELPCLTSVEQIHSLKSEEARRHQPVHIRGVVTYVRPNTADGVLQDSTRGVYVQDLAPPGFVPLHIGDFMEVEGKTSAGEFAPVLAANKVTPLGRGQLPVPMHPTWDQLMSGSVDCQYVELDGIITSAQEVPETSLQFLLREGHLQVTVQDFEFNDLARFAGAHVRLRGCLLAKWDAHTGHVTPGTIQLRAVTVHVEEPAPGNPLAIAAKRIAEIQQFDSHAGALDRVKVLGQMLHSRLGVHYLTDGTNGLRFQLATISDLRAGEQVEVAGFPELGGASPLLREAVVRKTGVAGLPRPRPLSPQTLLSQTNDAMLVEIDCRLVGVRPTPTETVLELQAGPRAFLARVETCAGAMTPLAIGSTLRLRGTYVAGSGNKAAGENNESFELLLNGPKDMEVLAQPSWWTPRRTIGVVGALAGVLVLATTWILALRRLVEHRTEELRGEIEERKQVEAKLSAEILERKRMEQEAERTHQELLIASREAGMAEVATSVLHNVGNVLNSITVSTRLVMQNVSQSKVASLAKVADLLRSHEQDFADFVLRDPKGQKLPGYLMQLADHLNSEQARTMDELHSLAHHVQNVEETVLMQQNYARISGARQRVSPKELLEDALRICTAALERQAIQVKRDYHEPVPDIQVDRHRVLQILLNLLSNAENACLESGRADMQLTVRLASQNDRVHIVVADNGVGIAPENLPRIFNQGFTTRKTGHGFALHNDALAANELGGALVAHSEGVDKGAVFTLELPSAH